MDEPLKLGVCWRIRHPGTNQHVYCDSFQYAMDKWFEGYNIPSLVVDGVVEDFSIALKRVDLYYENK